MRVMLQVAYDGTDYCGWQIQPSGVTIEEKLNEALTELLGEEIKVSGASRTDSGVHALCNLAVFDTDTRIPAEKISYAVNQRLPRDIRVRASLKVPDGFHPRFAKTIKTYEYRIFNSRFPDPLRDRYSFFTYYDLDAAAMKRAAAFLVGEHDFASFCTVGSQVESTVRTITDMDIDERPVDEALVCANAGVFLKDVNSGSFLKDVTTCMNEGDFVKEQKDVGIRDDKKIEIPPRRIKDREIIIRVSGTGFLYNMVRIIAGTLMEVGRGAIHPDDIPGIIDGRDRNLAGPTAPACGLTLVKYELL